MTVPSTDPRDLRLRQALAGLPARREPGRDLWPAIAARLPARGGAAALAPARRRGWMRAPWLALAAGLAVLLLVPAVLRPPAPPLPAGGMPLAALDPAPALLQAYGEVLASEATGAHGGVLLGAGDGARRAAARELDQATAVLAAALRNEPESQLLRRLLHQTLQQRAALARQSLDA